MGNFPVLSALNIIGTPIDEELRWSETTGEAAAGFELGSVSEHSYRNTALIDGWTFEPKSGKWYKRFNRPPRIYYADESENKRLTEIRVLREEMFGNDVIPADQDPDVIDGWLYQRNQGLWSKTVLTPGSEGTPKTTVIHPDPKTVALLDQQRQTRMPDRAGAAPSPPAVAAPATTGAPPQAPRRAPPEASSPARRSEAPPSIPGGRLSQVAGSAGAESPGATGPVASPQTAVAASGSPMPDPGPLAAGLTAVGPEDPAGSGIGAELARSAAPAATRRWDQSWAALTDAGGTWPAGHPGPGELRSLPTSLESAMRLMPAWHEPASLEPAAFGPPSRPRVSEAAVEGSGPPPASPAKPPYEGLPVLWESPGLTVFDMSSVPMPKLGTQPEAYPGGSGAEPSVGGRWSDTTAETMTPDAMRRIAREVVLEALDAQARKPRAFSREELRIITRAVFDRMDELADRPATGRAGFDGRMSKQFVSTYNPRGLRW